jgi:hypothetical protein
VYYRFQLSPIHGPISLVAYGFGFWYLRGLLPPFLGGLLLPLPRGLLPPPLKSPLPPLLIGIAHPLVGDPLAFPIGDGMPLC